MFNDLLIENSNINNYYWESNLPKFIKKSICKRKRKVLKKKIEYFLDTEQYTFNTADLYEFFAYCSIQPNNWFLGMSKYIYDLTVIEEALNRVYFATLKYHIDSAESNIKYSFNITSKKQQLFIDLYIENERGVHKIESVQADTEGLIKFSKSTNVTISNLIHGLSAMISEISSEFFEDQLTRSERIYQK